METTPKIFISYSWTTPAHQDWVINLAERLVSDAVDVSIDKWDLKEGHDKFDFMESMVKSPDIDKVLIILDKKYSEKANLREGGVGTETQIISPKVYSNVSQEKFLPIVVEKDENGKPFVPEYLDGRLFIDFSESEQFESSYENLLRNIYQRPAYQKPKLGKPPSYLFEETTMNFKTSTILRGFDNQISKNPKRINFILRDFLDEFYNNLKEFSINFTDQDTLNIGKEVCDNINSYTPLRNDFIKFFSNILNLELEFDVDIVTRFLEKLSTLEYPQTDKSNWYNYECDNFKFFIHELFLYLIVIGLKKENYKFVEELLYSSYFPQSRFEDCSEPKSFRIFYHHIDIIKQYYNKTYSQNFFSPMADLIIKRIPEGYSKDDIIDADLLCLYIAQLNGFHWFPLTYVYRLRGKMELLERMISIRHFEKVKVLFNVETITEFKEKIMEFQKNDKNAYGMRYSNSFDSVIPMYHMVKLDKIGTSR